MDITELALFGGASLLRPDMLEHWLEEGRVAIHRRGTELHRGKRKVQDQNFAEFTPVFCRPEPTASSTTSTHTLQEFSAAEDNNMSDDDIAEDGENFVEEDAILDAEIEKLLAEDDEYEQGGN